MSRAKIPTPRFHLKSPKSDSPTLINLSFQYHRGKVKYSTGEKVHPKYWDASKVRAKVVRGQESYAELNSELSRIEVLTKEIYKEFDFGEISVPDFKAELDIRRGIKQKRIKDNRQFFSFFEDYILTQNDRKKVGEIGEDQIIKIEITRGHLKEFEKYRKKKIRFEQIDKQFFRDFKKWSYEKKEHAISTVSKHITVIISVMEEARKMKVTDNQISLDKKLNVKVPSGNKLVMYEEELKLLGNANFKLGSWADKVRDMAIIGSWTGQRFSDFTRIKKDKVQSFKEMEFINLWSQKTDTEVAIPLVPQLKKVLEKYDYKCPQISMQKYNDKIKEVGRIAGVDGNFNWRDTTGGKLTIRTIKKYEKLSSHVCRRSFATNMVLMGVPPVVIMQITGHQSEAQFWKYVNISGKLTAKTVYVMMENYNKFNE